MLLDEDNSGKLDLMEFTDLVKSLQTFAKYDNDSSGDIVDSDGEAVLTLTPLLCVLVLVCVGVVCVVRGVCGVGCACVMNARTRWPQSAVHKSRGRACRRLPCICEIVALSHGLRSRSAAPSEAAEYPPASSPYLTLLPCARRP